MVVFVGFVSYLKFGGGFMTIVERREELDAELAELAEDYKRKREVVVEKLRLLRKSCPHDNVDYRGGGFWCKDCDYSR